MTDEQLETQIKAQLGDPRAEALIASYLPQAKSAIVSRLWPFDASKAWEDVPEHFKAAAAPIAVYLIGRRGGEGETSHAESGVTRSYESAGIPESYFAGMVPRIGVPR